MRHHAALLIHCSVEEAQKIREIAAHQRRTISGYVLNILMKAIRLDEGLARLRALGLDQERLVRNAKFHGLDGVSTRPPGPRTTILLSCRAEEAQRIRAAAKRREITISGLVLHALRLAWIDADEQFRASHLWEPAKRKRVPGPDQSR